MWTARSEELPDSRGLLYTLECDSRPATFGDVINGWQTDSIFRTFFNLLLAAAPLDSFRWETPGVSAGTLSQAFEFVLLASPELDSFGDPEAFAMYFTDAEVTAFPNLGGDAVLVVPSPIATPSTYPHLAAFVRFAPEYQQQALWKLVGEVMSERIQSKNVWLSTAGAAVSWLHIRLDSRPKYYKFAPYQ